MSVLLVSLFILMGCFLALMVSYSAQQYYQEVTQRLNRSIAMYIASEKPLIEGGVVNSIALKELAHQAMVINPGIEIYLIDKNGKIISHDLPEEYVQLDHVDLGPIYQLLSDDAPFPLRNTNPGNRSKKTIFSVAPVTDEGELQGYVYVVLEGKLAQDLAVGANQSYVLKLGFFGIGSLLVFFFGTIILIVSHLTSRLNKLKNDVVSFQFNNAPRENENPVGDEIDQLCDAFMHMRLRINEQIQEIQRVDKSRRDLIGNISHDLRTPITSMQGYVETLLLQSDKLTEKQAKHYMQTVYKHCLHIDGMVAELFELSRLDSHTIQPQIEEFSLAELLQDIAHEFQLSCDKKSINLETKLIQGDTRINADIRLMQRVFENLLANAVRHTPTGGKICLEMQVKAKHIMCKISDTGKGISPQEIPYIFDRLYQADSRAKHKDGTLGLGLAIVKRILDLHSSDISVKSAAVTGTCFSFSLERASKL